MKTNIQTRKLIAALKKAGQGAPLWQRIASELERPTRHMSGVNLVKLNTYLQAGEIAVVPGKVLSVGTLTKKLSVAALHFSDAARAKIAAAKGEALSIEELLQRNPKGNKVRIFK